MKILFVLLILIISEKLCIFLAAFLFGYIFGYNLFEILKYRNKKDEIHEFFSSYKKNMAKAIDEITKSLKNISISKDNFLGNDFSIERNFCDAVSELLGKDLKDCEVSTFLGKKLMAICCETYVLNEITGKSLLKVIDQMVDEHFFKKYGLLKLGWCSHYMTDSRKVCYKLNEKVQSLNFIG